MTADLGTMSSNRALPDQGRRWLWQALQVLGSAQAKAALQAAELGDLAASDLAIRPTHQDLGRLEQAIEERYGPRGARPALLRVGRALFQVGVDETPATRSLGARILKLPVRPLKERARFFLQRVIAAQGSALEQYPALEQDAEAFTILLEHCPCEYRPPHAGPCCHLLLGMYEEAARWFAGKPACVEEITCIATGADACRFRIEIR